MRKLNKLQHLSNFEFIAGVMFACNYYVRKISTISGFLCINSDQIFHSAAVIMPGIACIIQMIDHNTWHSTYRLLTRDPQCSLTTRFHERQCCHILCRPKHTCATTLSKYLTWEQLRIIEYGGTIRTMCTGQFCIQYTRAY